MYSNKYRRPGPGPPLLDNNLAINTAQGPGDRPPPTHAPQPLRVAWAPPFPSSASAPHPPCGPQGTPRSPPRLRPSAGGHHQTHGPALGPALVPLPGGHREKAVRSDCVWLKASGTRELKGSRRGGQGLGRGGGSAIPAQMFRATPALKAAAGAAGPAGATRTAQRQEGPRGPDTHACLRGTDDPASALPPAPRPDSQQGAAPVPGGVTQWLLGGKIVNVLVPFTKPQPKKITHRIPERKCAAGCPGCPAVDGSSGQAAAQGLTTSPERWAPMPTTEAGGARTDPLKPAGSPGHAAWGRLRVRPGSGGPGRRQAGGRAQVRVHLADRFRRPGLGRSPPSAVSGER